MSSSNSVDCALFWASDMYRKTDFFSLWKRCHVELHQMEIYIRRNSKSSSIEKTIFISDKTDVSLIEQGNSPPLLKISESPSDPPITLTADEEEIVIQLFVAIKSAMFNNETLSIDDFTILSVLGRGNFGKVTLVKMKRNNDNNINRDKYYALKSVHKMKLIQTNKVHTAINERNILAKNKHPFIVSLKFAFQSATKFYIGMEFLSGGDLRFYMKRMESKNEKISLKDIKIYIAEIALALEHLHSNEVVYCDLKPENVMIADDGHIKLTDFGLAQNIGKDGNSRSMCGTLEYIPPEIVVNQTYSFPVDWWSLGIVTYELIFGVTPFRDENRGRLFAKILNEDVKFPNGTDPNIKDFIKKLLIKDQTKRWNFKKLKDHPFWDNMNFDDILAKKHTPEFVPNCGSSIENFSSEYTDENPFDSFAVPPIGVKSVGVNGFSYMGSFTSNLSDSPSVTPSNLIPQEEREEL